MKTDQNDSAFPVVGNSESKLYEGYGLTKREYFTAMAMKAFIIANPNTAMKDKLCIAEHAEEMAIEQMKQLNNSKQDNQ